MCSFSLQITVFFSQLWTPTNSLPCYHHQLLLSPITSIPCYHHQLLLSPITSLPCYCYHHLLLPFVALSLSFPSPPWTKLNKCSATGCFVYFHHYSTYINKTNSIYAYLISDTPEQLKTLCDCTYHYRNRINHSCMFLVRLILLTA